MSQTMVITTDWKNRSQYFEGDKKAQSQIERTIANYFDIFKALPLRGFIVTSEHLCESMIIDEVRLSENEIRLFLVPYDKTKTLPI